MRTSAFFDKTTKERTRRKLHKFHLTNTQKKINFWRRQSQVKSSIEQQNVQRKHKEKWEKKHTHKYRFKLRGKYYKTLIGTMNFNEIRATFLLIPTISLVLCCICFGINHFFPMTYGFFFVHSMIEWEKMKFSRSMKFSKFIYNLMKCKNNFSFSFIVASVNKSCEIFHSLFIFLQRMKKKDTSFDHIRMNNWMHLKCKNHVFLIDLSSLVWVVLIEILL